MAQLQEALRRGARTDQNGIVRQLLSIRAPMGDRWRELAMIALHNGENTLAREAIDFYVELQGQSPLALYHKAMMLEQLGDVAGAYALLQTLPEDVPNPAMYAYSRGADALFLGQTGDAREQLERATKLCPELGAAWLMLATSCNLAAEPTLADRIVEAKSVMAEAVPSERAPYFYALGKVHAERGEHAPAFAAFAQGGEAMKLLVRYNADLDQRNAGIAVRDYTRDKVGEISRLQQEPTDSTIFVTGMPRSGTTLVEQILASHSHVVDGAELNRLLLLAREVGGLSGGSLKRYVDANGVAGAARLWRHWMQEQFPGFGKVVDKSLTTTRLLGLAACLLPQAPLIWVTREPLDCAWSCFATFFSNMPWSYGLEDIGTHFRIENDLRHRWQEVLGDRLLVLSYEALVSDPGTWIPRILSHCGLALEAQVFAPHENARAIRTASAMQVRRPIHRRAIGSAQPFREFMEPFVTAYHA